MVGEGDKQGLAKNLGQGEWVLAEILCTEENIQNSYL